MSGSEPGGPTEVTPIFWQPNFSISTDLYHRKRILYISSWGPYIFCYQTRRLVWRRRWQDLLVSFPNIFVDQRHARPHLCPRTLAGIIQRFTLYLASLVLFDLYFVRRWCFENGLVFFSVRGGGASSCKITRCSSLIFFKITVFFCHFYQRCLQVWVIWEVCRQFHVRIQELSTLAIKRIRVICAPH